MATGGESDLDTIIPDIGSDDFHHAENDILINENKPGCDVTFSTKTRRENTALIVENKRIYVSSTVLSLASPVFSEMFEDDEGGEHEHELPGKKYEDILEFVQCIYPNIVKEITRKNVFIVLPLAVEYEARFLIERCEAFMFNKINQNTSLKTLCLYLTKISENRLSQKLQDKCIQQAAMRNFKELCDAETKYPIPLESKVEIQKKEIEKNKKRLSQLTQEKLNYENVLNAIDVKKQWFLNDKVLSYNNYRVGFLKHIVKVTCKSSVSPKISVYGLRLKVQMYVKDGQNIQIYLRAEPLTKCLGWYCRIFAKFCLLRKKGSKSDMIESLEHVFAKESTRFGYTSFVSGNLQSMGFVDDFDLLHFEIKLLVEKPTFYGLEFDTSVQSEPIELEMPFNYPFLYGI